MLVFLNSITPVAVEMVYAIAEAIAAPFIPITGIRTKSKMIVVTAEKIAVYVPPSNRSLPDRKTHPYDPNRFTFD